jgi:hypothetical protein
MYIYNVINNMFQYWCITYILDTLNIQEYYFKHYLDNIFQFYCIWKWVGIIKLFPIGILITLNFY